MNLKYISHILIVLLVIFNIFLNIKTRAYRNELTIKQNEIQRKDFSIDALNLMVDAIFQSNIVDSEWNYALSNLLVNKGFETGEKIIFLMQNGGCNSCFFQILQDLSIVEEKIGSGHVIVVTNIGTKDQPFEFQEFDFPVFYTDTIHLPPDITKEPILFVADNKTNIKFLYFPELLPEFRHQYFNEYLPEYLSKNTRKN